MYTCIFTRRRAHRRRVVTRVDVQFGAIVWWRGGMYTCIFTRRRAHRRRVLKRVDVQFGCNGLPVTRISSR